MLNFSKTLWHGADYNPEQWLEEPGIWDADGRLMKLAHMSSASVGIFSWAMLEPREGEFHFEWLDEIFERLEKNGQRVVLATPSGAKPHWMARKYPEIRRVAPERGRQAQKARHNHCMTSPVYREKTAIIDHKLAQRYGNHPALLAWHISNEFSGECHCDLCFGAFQNWLRTRYDNDLDKLNRAYWSRFWSHSYGEWEEIDFIDRAVHGLNLDWLRFTNQQTIDFYLHEVAAIRAHSQVPATTNFMGDFTGLDYAAWAPHLDFVCWDAYPQWGKNENDVETACWSAFHHDMFRAIKGQPFWLMECSPSQTNWRDVSKLKAPGVHLLSAWQTVAHGGDAIMYFQWRQSRGSSEKFHGAVVSHEGTENNRVFREVAKLGAELEALSAIAGSETKAQTALIFDFENLWAIHGEQGPRNASKNPEETAREFYRPLWERNISVDVITSTADFTGYKLIVAPMLYMLRPGVAQRLTDWVHAGGTLVTTYMSGLADENDLCFLGGFPGPLREVLGIRVEETDTLHAHQTNVVRVGASELPIPGRYIARDYCDLVHLEGARALGWYQNDFYAQRPALTVNDYGAGRAYYVASRNEVKFQSKFIGALASQLDLPAAIQAELPYGTSAQKRSDAENEWVWVMNFTSAPQEWIPREEGFESFDNGHWENIPVNEVRSLPPHGVEILRRALL